MKKICLKCAKANWPRYEKEGCYRDCDDCAPMFNLGF
jgi:hypothetical protein